MHSCYSRMACSIEIKDNMGKRTTDYFCPADFRSLLIFAVVVSPFAALLPRPILEFRADQSPHLCSMLHDHLNHLLILFRGPFAYASLAFEIKCIQDVVIINRRTNPSSSSQHICSHNTTDASEDGGGQSRNTWWIESMGLSLDS